MRFRMPVLAAGALAAALAFGPSVATSADPIPKLNDFAIVDADPFALTLFVDAPPELEGTEAMILHGGQPFQGMVVGGSGLAGGPNMIMVPNMGPGWYSAVGAFKARSSNFDELPDEE